MIAAAKMLLAAAAAIGAVLGITYAAAGCKEDTCNRNGVCSGLIAQCACTGLYAGEYCEAECDCSGNGNQTAIEAVRAAPFVPFQEPP
eukprot:COSAG04_NODE_6943_length_1223_cov_1.238434_2_plen_87_part_01